MGGTSNSYDRRSRDPYLMDTVFRGHALDIGGGDDPLTVDERYPNLTRVDVIDKKTGGDGTDLGEYANQSVDLVYSSHCLEHIPVHVHRQAVLTEWWRVVRPGGFLYVQVPDEEYYEQFLWPSRFNGEHVHSFSLYRARSPMPMHVDLLPIALNVIAADGELERAMRLPWGSTLCGDDNTGPWLRAEAGLEILARRIRP